MTLHVVPEGRAAVSAAAATMTVPLVAAQTGADAAAASSDVVAGGVL